MVKYTIDEYDRKALREAKQRIMIVYNYHYGEPNSNALTKRIETIITKIDYWIEDGKEDGN